MENFTNTLIENINGRVPLFVVDGMTWKYTFVRIPTKNPRVEELMYGQVFRSGDGAELLRKMEQFCVLVDNVPYNCEYLADVAREDSDPETSAFFKKTFGDVIDDVEKQVSEKILTLLESLPDGELVPDEKERKEIANPERLAPIMHNLIVSGVVPQFEVGCVLYDTNYEKTAINYLLYGERAIDDICKSVVDNNQWSAKKRTFFAYKAKKAYFEAHKDDLSADDIEIRKIKDALNEALAIGAKKVSLYVDGDDDMISLYVRNSYPEFSIAGKELEMKASPTLAVDAERGSISHWSVSVENVVLRKKYSNNREDFLKDFPITKIKRISYRKKDLYCRT